jgi:Cu(I)/Ag(I) efflux system protein CusF
MTAVRLILAGIAAADVSPRFGPNEGEVLAIDRKEREITIRHGYLPELDMDPMSMVFVVADVRLLDAVRKGDRVRFKPGLVGGRFGVIEITPLRNARR